MNADMFLTKIEIIVLFLVLGHITATSQHAIYPDLIIMGSDSLQPLDDINDTIALFNTQKGGLVLGIIEGDFVSSSADNMWHPDSMGVGSFALGRNALALGENGSVAIGNESIASGNNGSLAVGKVVRASGDGSLAFGDMCSVSSTGAGSLAGGFETRVSGAASIAFGNWSSASGFSSVALGSYANANGDYSIAMGRNTNVEGHNGATAIGDYLRANANSGLVAGQYNDPIVSAGYDGSDKPLFILGNGTSNSDRSNAMIVRQTGGVEFSNYKFPISDGTTGQVLKTNGSGQLSWAQANEVMVCPSGFIDLKTFCISKEPSGVDENLEAAINACHNLNSVAQLPTYQQFNIAVNSNQLVGNLSTFNWIGDLTNDSGIQGTVVLANDAADVKAETFLSKNDFRCVIEK